MQLLDILEPIAVKKKFTEDVVIGIDLGTTNSLAAIFQNGKVRTLGRTIPSRVKLVNDQIEIDFGNDTKSLVSIKRFMGKTWNNISDIEYSNYNLAKATSDNQIKLILSESEYAAEELAAVILKNVIKEAESILQKKVTKAVITVPAYFDDGARQATLKAAKIVGIEVLRLINEPTSAALAYGLNNYKEGIYGVYDFGGGTFDSTILQMKMGVFKVIATAGDNNLGGDDIDRLMVESFLTQNNLNSKISPNLFLELKDQFRKIKEQLSKQKNIDTTIIFNSKSYPFSITQAEFKTLSNNILGRTYQLFNLALADANVKIDELEGIIMVGGSSRIKFIKEYFGKIIAKNKIFDNHDPEIVVAEGAAIQAHNLIEPQGNLLIDVVPLSLAIEIMGGLCEKIIHKNTPIPISVKKTFTTYEDGQTGMIFNILQGEREFAKDCRSLAKFELKEIPAMKAGVPKIEVEFRVDTDGILTVSSNELSTKKSITIEVNPIYGITSNEVEEMIRSSYENAAKDIMSRNEQELILNAENLVKSLQTAMDQYPTILSISEKTVIDVQLKAIQQAILDRNLVEIEQNLFSLGLLSEDFASRQLSQSLSQEIKGKTIDFVKNKFLKE